jgi:hypothetical protein
MTKSMNQQLAFVIIAVALCCGCQAEPPLPVATSQTNDNDASSPISRSPEAAGRESGELIDADASDKQQGYVSFPAAGVKLMRPAGFDDAENFHGFQQPSTQSSVMVVMIPGPYAETTRGFTADQFKTRGMTLRSKETIEINGMAGLLLSVKQNGYGTEFAKWIVALGDESETTLVTATFPESEETNLSDALRAVVLSTKSDDAPAPTPGTDSVFAIDASAKLKLTRGIGKMLSYSKDGTIPTESPQDPIFIAAPSLSGIPIDNKRQFAVQRLFQTAHTRITSVTSNTAITIDALEGYEIVADAEDVDSGTALKVYQVILYDEESYFLMQGLVGVKLADEYLPEFKAMARSFTRDSQ